MELKQEFITTALQPVRILEGKQRKSPAKRLKKQGERGVAERETQRTEQLEKKQLYQQERSASDTDKKCIERVQYLEKRGKQFGRQQAEETLETRMKRLERNRLQAAQRRAEESDEKRNERLTKARLRQRQHVRKTKEEHLKLFTEKNWQRCNEAMEKTLSNEPEMKLDLKEEFLNTAAQHVNIESIVKKPLERETVGKRGVAETEEQQIERLEKRRQAYYARRQAEETEEQRARRLERYRLQKRKQRERETEEKRIARLETERQRMARREAEETEEEHIERLARLREWRARTMTQEKRANRLEKRRQRQARETVEQRTKRLEKKRHQKAASRLAGLESAVEKILRIENLQNCGRTAGYGETEPEHGASLEKLRQEKEEAIQWIQKNMAKSFDSGTKATEFESYMLMHRHRMQRLLAKRHQKVVIPRTTACQYLVYPSQVPNPEQKTYFSSFSDNRKCKGNQAVSSKHRHRPGITASTIQCDYDFDEDQRLSSCHMCPTCTLICSSPYRLIMHSLRHHPVRVNLRSINVKELLTRANEWHLDKSFTDEKHRDNYSNYKNLCMSPYLYSNTMRCYESMSPVGLTHLDCRDSHHVDTSECCDKLVRTTDSDGCYSESLLHRQSAGQSNCYVQPPIDCFDVKPTLSDAFTKLSASVYNLTNPHPAGNLFDSHCEDDSNYGEAVSSASNKTRIYEPPFPNQFASNDFDVSGSDECSTADFKNQIDLQRMDDDSIVKSESIRKSCFNAKRKKSKTELPVSAENLRLMRSCSLCGKLCQTRGSLYSHMRKHRRFMCEGCGKSFFSDLVLKRHQISCKAAGGQKYNLSGSNTSTSTRENDNDEKWKYDVEAIKQNGFEILSNTNSVQNIAMHRHGCTVCSRRFEKPKDLRRHMMVHFTDIKAYVCKKCGEGFRSQWQLNSHRIACLSEDEQAAYSCLDRHRQRLHRLGAPTGARHIQRIETSQQCREVCATCGKLISAHNMSTHIQAHSGGFPFVCNQCGRGFNRSRNLDTHQLTHSDPNNTRQRKPNEPAREVCATCGKLVSVKHMAEHILVHSGELPFVCSQCGRGFNRRRNLLTHRLTHSDPNKTRLLVGTLDNSVFKHNNVTMIRAGRTKEKLGKKGDKAPVLMCTYCEKTFKMKWNLKVHLLTHMEHDRVVDSTVNPTKNLIL